MATKYGFVGAMILMILIFAFLFHCGKKAGEGACGGGPEACARMGIGPRKCTTGSVYDRSGYQHVDTSYPGDVTFPCWNPRPPRLNVPGPKCHRPIGSQDSAGHDWSASPVGNDDPMQQYGGEVAKNNWASLECYTDKKVHGNIEESVYGAVYKSDKCVGNECCGSDDTEGTTEAFYSAAEHANPCYLDEDWLRGVGLSAEATLPLT